jgi:putative peptide zinc metalloprotease protein
LFAVSLVFYPWQTSISVPAILKSAQYQKLFVSEPGQINRLDVTIGQTVAEGDWLLAISSDDLDQAIFKTQNTLSVLEEKLRRANSTTALRELAAGLTEEMLREQSRLLSLLERQDKLILRAPFDAQVVALTPLNLGDYISRETAVMALLGADWQLHAYIASEDLNVATVGAQGVFVANNGEKIATEFRVSQILPSALTELPYAELGSVYQGAIAARQKEAALIPEYALYEVILAPTTPITPNAQRLLGQLVLAGQPESIFDKVRRQVYSVFIRESGF